MAANSSTRPTSHAAIQHRERLLGMAAIAAIVIAWFVGAARSQGSVTPYLPAALPGAQRFEALPNGVYAGWAADAAGERLAGYVAVGEAAGYGGPMKVAVGVDPQGNLAGVAVIEQKETRAFLLRVLGSRLPAELVDRHAGDRIALGEDVDAVSGATYTSRALVDAVHEAARLVAARQLGLSVPPEPPRPVRIGVPEVVLVALYAIGFVGHRQSFKYKKQARWLSMLAGLVVLGFLYNSPLTLTNINSLLMGFWPEWQSHLYWYLLVGGILFVFTVDNKNPYCEWFCPFGAAQECLGAIGGAKPRTPPRFREALRWAQRGIAWLAIMIALLFRNPGLGSYEVFGTLFSLTGSGIQFVLLVVVLLAALFVRRPWCNYLCPLRPVTDLIKLMRAWVLDMPAIVRIRQQWPREAPKPTASNE